MSGVVTPLKREFTTERITNALKLFCDNIGGGKCADLALGQLRHLTETKPTEPEQYKWDNEQLESSRLLVTDYLLSSARRWRLRGGPSNDEP